MGILSLADEPCVCAGCAFKPLLFAATKLIENTLTGISSRYRCLDVLMGAVLNLSPVFNFYFRTFSQEGRFGFLRGQELKSVSVNVPEVYVN